VRFSIAGIFIIILPAIKSLWAGYLELKYKLIILIFGGYVHHLVSYAHTEHTHKFLMRMLSERFSSFYVCSAYFERNFSF
jgi:hypothetical protein